MSAPPTTTASTGTPVVPPPSTKYQTVWNEDEASIKTRKEAQQSTCFGFVVENAANLIVWHEKQPADQFEISWTEEYGVYATKSTISDPKVVPDDNGNIPAKLGQIYEWDGTKFATGQSTDAAFIGIKNTSTAVYAFGISKKNDFTGKLEPISYDQIFHGQTLFFQPKETILAIMGTNRHMNMIIGDGIGNPNYFDVNTLRKFVYQFDEATSNWEEYS